MGVGIVKLVFTGCIKKVELGTYSKTYRVTRNGETCEIDIGNFDDYNILGKGSLVRVYKEGSPFDYVPRVIKLGRVREERYWK